jgi:hypothetical protein
MLFGRVGLISSFQDYVLTGYIAEVINTVSNLTYRTYSIFALLYLHFLPVFLPQEVEIT